MRLGPSHDRAWWDISVLRLPETPDEKTHNRALNLQNQHPISACLRFENDSGTLRT